MAVSLKLKKASKVWCTFRKWIGQTKMLIQTKLFILGQEVEVMVLDVDAERRRISLGVKQCTSNPWAAFAENHEKNETC